MKTGTQLIAEERQRQMDVEGWNAQHDSRYENNELVRAAVVYAAPIVMRQMMQVSWPWDSKWFKPTPDDRVRELTKAGALIAAEIDRLQSQSFTGGKQIK